MTLDDSVELGSPFAQVGDFGGVWVDSDRFDAE